jgi:hypothetical protein
MQPMSTDKYAKVTEHDMLLAREVIAKAAKNYVNCIGPEQGPEARQIVLNNRWPVNGNGGVAHANARTQRAVRLAIEMFYEPDDWSPEPTGYRS